MARALGTRHRKVGGPFMLMTWPETPTNRLYTRNENGGNDAQIAALFDAQGDPDDGGRPVASAMNTD